MKKVKVPPIKIQGIKTKLVPFIIDSINWDGDGTYFEPFMGSGVVGFNLATRKAIFSDTNPYLIKFYKDLQEGVIKSDIVREYLEIEGKILWAICFSRHKITSKLNNCISYQFRGLYKF